MGMRVRAWWETHWLAAIVVAVALPVAFIAAGWIWGREVTFVTICSGPLPPATGDCTPPYTYVELNLAAGPAAAAVVVVVLVATGAIARRLDR